jgi:hypothetical protein
MNVCSGLPLGIGLYGRLFGRRFSGIRCIARAGFGPVAALWMAPFSRWLALLGTLLRLAKGSDLSFSAAGHFG